jgi:hypothetical protein
VGFRGRSRPVYSATATGRTSRTAVHTSDASTRARLASFNCGSRQSSAYRTSTAYGFNSAISSTRTGKRCSKGTSLASALRSWVRGAEVGEQALQILFGGLLTMKRDSIERATFLDCHDPACRFEVILRFANPLPEYLNNLRRHVHRGPCPHVKPASTQCSPRSDNARNGNWSKRQCP